MRNAQHCSALSILMLLEVCVGDEYRRPCRPNALLLGVLARARYKCLEDRGIVKYLLLDYNNQYSSTNTSNKSRHLGTKTALTGPRKQALAAKIIDLLLMEVTTLLQELDSSTNLMPDTANLVTTLCIVSYSISAHSHARASRRHDELHGTTKKLAKTLMASVSSAGKLTMGKENMPSDGIFESFANVTPSIAELLTEKSLVSKGILLFLRAMDIETWGELCSRDDSGGASRDMDEEVSDDDFGSQARKGRLNANTIAFSHDAAAAISDSSTCRRSLIALFCFISSTGAPTDESCPCPVMTHPFVEYVTSLPASIFICCRHFMLDLFASEISVGTEEATLLLQYLGKQLLQSYTYERSELAIGISLDVVTGIVDLWTNPENVDVSEAAVDIYDWLTNVALRRRLASPHVLVCMSVLLQRLVRISPEYGNSLDLPSARTSLFQVLEFGNLDVKFFVGNNLSDIFGLFVLKEHEDILQDVIKNLPSAADWPDGIALRLYILCRLAQSWPTLLRRCVYGIYETPVAVPASAGHAQWCLSQVSKSLQLQDSRELFKLFAPQILYTWLEEEALHSIPFSIFGYESLKSLLLDVQDEVVSQIVMRQKEHEGAQLSQELGSPLDQIIEASIGKVTAYSISQGVAVPPSKRVQGLGAEARLRKMLGKERYVSLVASNFHDVLLTFFKCIDDERSIEKAFEDHRSYGSAQNCYQEMKTISCSTEALPINQQPVFKARYLFDQIAHVCRRTASEVESIWSPSLYVFLFRGLLTILHPALGSQHACSTIRKLRILVSLAGTTALQSYPVEMALQSLRPFLTDTHCSEDSIGVFQYLLMAGDHHLRDIPTFIAGLGIITLTSLKAFLGSSQESTTQESQYKATMSKAADFHAWLGTYMINYKPTTLSEDAVPSFHRMFEAARKIRASGNAHSGSHESDLLLELLEDQASGRNLLNQPSRESIFRLLCVHFGKPLSFREDILGLDSEAVSYAPMLGRMLQSSDYGVDFQLWVGRVLGRAYAASGVADRRMTLEIDPDIEDMMTDRSDTVEPANSQLCILRTLCDMLLTDDRKQVGIIENTLRLVISRAEDLDILIEYQDSIPPSVITGLLWKNYNCPAQVAVDASKSSLESAANAFHGLSAQSWVQDLCVALALTAKDDLLLSELPYLLSQLPGICDRLFPFIVHLTLLREAKGHQKARSILSTACQRLFDETGSEHNPHTRIMLKTIVYLRKQPWPQEMNKSDRSQWLNIDHYQAASAAVRCSMFKTALLFLDVGFCEAAKVSRRSSAVKVEEPTELLLQIYTSIDEQDSFYGVQQPSSLSAMMARLEYEHAGFKSLSFRGAHYDSQIRFSPATTLADEEGMVQALETLDLNGLSQSLLGKMTNLSQKALQTKFNTARKLEQWDLSAPASGANSSSLVFRVFQGLNKPPQAEAFVRVIDLAFEETINLLQSGDITGSSIHEILGTLAVLTEVDELSSIRNLEQLEDVWLRFEEREEWMYTERCERRQSE